jgi:FkbM family methyltransferase
LINILASYLNKTLAHLGISIVRNERNICYENIARDLERNIPKFCRGVVHIGGHFGEEREVYAKYELPVIWIEADPENFRALEENTKPFLNQIAVMALLGSANQDEVEFYVANNNGASSSILRLNSGPGFAGLKQNEIKHLPMRRLDSILEYSTIANMDLWVIDVQGSELEVLKGAGLLLSIPKIIQLEVSTYPIYTDQPLFAEVNEFMLANRFIPIIEPKGRFHGNAFFIRLND